MDINKVYLGDCLEIMPSIQDKSKIQVIDEETYLSINDASRQDIGDSALHKNIGTGRAKKQAIEHQAKLDRDLLIRRERLRQEYQVKVQLGEIRPPTRIEYLISTANGNPDNTSVLQVIKYNKHILSKLLKI